MSIVIRFVACAVLISTRLLSPGEAEAQWGTIKGQVTVIGNVPALRVLVHKNPAVGIAEDIPDESLVIDPKSNGLANVLVWVPRKPGVIHPDLASSKSNEVVFKLKGHRFIPHVLLVRTDQQVRVVSEDGVAENVHTNFVKNDNLNVLLNNDRLEIVVANLTQAERFPRRVNCDLHAWMDAYWVILDHPYVAVTNEKGEFEIANLPEGEHEFRVWQEKIGYVEKSYKVTVKAGMNTLDPIKVPAERFMMK